MVNVIRSVHVSKANLEYGIFSAGKGQIAYFAVDGHKKSLLHF
jgi:hypothetical protein